MNINLHIEQLILDGLPLTEHERPFLQAALQAELSRLLTANGLSLGLQAGGAVPDLTADRIQLNSEHNPTRLGQQIARAVYRGIGQ